MSELLVNTIKKADGSGGLTVPSGTGTVATLSGGTFTGAIAMGANNISFSNGNGIDFSASEGSGASSSVLDDYEEGTWTPTDASGAGMTLTTTASQYTKIGDMVFVCAEVNFPSTSSTAHTKIGGLPFTSTDNGAWAGVVRYTNSSEDPTITHVNNNDYMTWYEKNGGIFINTSASGHRFDFILIYKAA